MNQEYGIVKGWKVVLLVFLPALGLGMVYLALSPFIEQSKRSSDYILMLSIALPVIVICILGLLDAVRSRLTISNDAFILRDWRKVKEIPFLEVKGFRRNDQKYIVLEPINEGYKPFKIHPYFEKKHEWEGFIAERFTDLDALDLKEAEEEMMQDESLGGFEFERGINLKKYRQQARLLNIAGGITSAWLIFFPRPYEWAVTITALVPLAVLFFSWRSGGMIRVDEVKNSPYPNASAAFLFATLTSCLRALLDVSYLSFRPLVTITVVLGLLLYVVTVVVTKALRTRKTFLASLLHLFLLGSYAYGVVTQFNVINDRSPVRIYSAKVLRKRMSSGKTTTLYLTLSSWGPVKKEDEVSVPRRLYHAVDTGEMVKVYLREGWLKAEWFWVGR